MYENYHHSWDWPMTYKDREMASPKYYNIHLYALHSHFAMSFKEKTRTILFSILRIEKDHLS